MPNPRGMSSDWYYDSPATERPATEPQAMSQIPGLSSYAADVHDEVDGQHRQWIQETDSDYIKLAKQGGTKDLICFPEAKGPEEPVPYYRPDWADNIHDKEVETCQPMEQIFQKSKRRQPKPEGYRVLPEWYVHDHSTEDLQTRQATMQAQAASAHAKKRPMNSFDNLSTWDR